MVNSLISLGLYSNIPRKKLSNHSIQKSKTSAHGKLLAGHQNLSSLLPNHQTDNIPRLLYLVQVTHSFHYAWCLSAHLIH